MQRHEIPARRGWRATVESQGLVYPTTPMPDGGERPYWVDDAYYELTADEVDHLETATDRLHGMCLEAARYIASGEMGGIGLPAGALEVARESLAAWDAGGAPSLYGRFDLRFDGTGPAKMLEYNADTPTGLLEAAAVQWFWLEDRFPDLDQWNSIHERLVRGWHRMRPKLVDAPVWFAHHEDETSGEELMTVTYLRDTAEQAGLAAESILLGDIGWDARRGCFVGERDGRLTPIRTCFALYPWESMLAEPFGAHVQAVPDPRLGTTWIEPPWKALLSTKALLAALWRIYPDHELLLPAYLDDPGTLDAWVAKPLHGREGDGIRIHAPGIEHTQPGGGGEEGWCYQQWAPLPDYAGNKPVLGCWVVDGHAAGLGVRESDGWVTDDVARFVPHVIAAPRPDEATQARWIAQDA